MIWIIAAAYVFMAGLIGTSWLYRRFLQRPSPIDPTYRPPVAVLVPVRDLDPEIERHLESLFRLDYPSYEIVFAVAERDDPAYPILCRLCAEHPERARVVLAGLSERCSEKIHNILAGHAAVSQAVEVLVVVDADIEVHPLFLQRLVTPLRDSEVGAVTGYRWLVATERTLPRTIATMTNAAGAVSFWLSNNVWGGTVAIRRATFEKLEVPAVWRKSVSDDLTLRALLGRHGLKVVSVSDALGVSHQAYGWRSYWEFLVRQLIIARVYTPGLWWQVVALYAVTMSATAVGVVGTVGWLAGEWQSTLPLWALPLPLLFMGQGWLVIDAAQRAIRRRGEVIPELGCADLPVYVLAVAVGVAQLWSSATRRWIVWRGVLYRLHAADHTEVVRRNTREGAAA
jgi:Glycosyltransferase like family 2